VHAELHVQVSFQPEDFVAENGRVCNATARPAAGEERVRRAQPMRNRRQRTDPVARLRVAIDCLPVATREAMLDAVEGSERVIAGAYVDEDGGVCPMLAAHRRGERTDFLTFAKSWDRFTRVAGTARRATPRELAILTGQLQESLMSATGLELDRAISEHRELRSARMRRARALLDGADPCGDIVARRLRPPRRRVFFREKFARRIDRRLSSPVASRV
jgi:hypothetical protein